MSTPLCLYTTSSGQLYVLAQFSNWIVPLFITAMSFTRDQKTGRKGVQFALFWFSWYLVVWQAVLWEIQTALHVMRPDPFCPAIMTYGFPSSTAFYTSVGGSFIFVMMWLNYFEMSITLALLIASCWLIIPTVLIWFTFNVWQEVLVSYGLGIIVTVPYFLALRLYLLDVIPYFLNQPPCTWMGCVDTLIQSDAGQQKTESLRLWRERRVKEETNPLLLFE